MKSTLILCISILSLNLHAQVMHSGSMSQMGANGFTPIVSIDSLLAKDNLYGLGPYGKMRGEITVINGVPMVAYADENGELTVNTDNQAKAPFFVYAYVGDWKTYQIVLNAENPSDIQEAVQKLAQLQGHDLSRPFPFRIQGEFNQLTLHVVSPRSPDVSGYKAGIKSHKYNFRDIEGEIFGFYSQSGQGIYTSKNSFVHLHFSTKDQSKMGHVDAINLPSKKVMILLPKKMTNK